MTRSIQGHLFAGRQLWRRSAAGRRDRRTHLWPGIRWEDEGGKEDGRVRSAVLGDVHGAWGLEEAVPGADDLGQASAVGGVPEGDRSGDDLDKDRAGVGVPPCGVPGPEVDTDAFDVRGMRAVDLGSGQGTSAAASGVMIGSADADADADGERGVQAAAGPSPSVLNAIAVPAAAVTAPRSQRGAAGWADQSHGCSLPLLRVVPVNDPAYPGLAGTPLRTFTVALSGSAQGAGRSSRPLCAALPAPGRLRVASGEGGCRGRQIETMADDTGVGIRLLGGFEATVGGRPVAAGAWRLRNARTLVKLLVLADGHRMHRESLVALLWPDRDTASGMNNLHQALHVARRMVAPRCGGRRGAVVDTMA